MESKMTGREKAQKVDELHAQGVSITDAAQQVGINPTYYYQLKNPKQREKKKKQQPPQQPAQPVTLHITDTSDRVIAFVGPRELLAELRKRTA